MPKGYEEIRDGLIAKGVPKAKAEETAARIWNANNPKNPVGPGSDKKKQGGK
jgi:hypothetical protein